MILPALALGQYAIARFPVQQAGSDRLLPAPSAAVLWARVSDEVDTRIRASKKSPQIDPQDWNSGTNHWVIHTLGEQTAIGSLLTKLRAEQVEDASPAAPMIRPEGQVKIIDFPAPESPA